jgi:hypothetical protein
MGGQMMRHRRKFSQAGIFTAAMIGASAMLAVPAAANGLRAPQPPGNAAATLRLPPRDAGGEFETPNRDLHGERAFWNVRIALNVAAIGCRGPRAAGLVADYNHLLGRHAALVRSSEALVIANLARSGGNNGIAARDKLSTRLFNYFAQPPAQADFCNAAAEVAAEVAEGSSENARLRATALLARLDQPFVDFYHAYERYRIELTAWNALGNNPATRNGDVHQASFGRGQ